MTSFFFSTHFTTIATKAKKKFCVAGTGILNATCQKPSPVELDARYAVMTADWRQNTSSKGGPQCFIQRVISNPQSHWAKPPNSSLPLSFVHSCHEPQVVINKDNSPFMNLKT